MLAVALGDIARACGGTLAHAGDGARCTGVCIDSRAVRPGDLFVALPGEHTDGHAFAGDAIERGAVAVVARTELGAIPAVVVTDPAEALTRIAAEIRSRSRARVVAITGSSGKTCTKQFIAAVCATRYRTVASEASFNNELGVPLTICGLEEDTEVLVAEVGSRGVGHIASLMPLLRPDVSVVTNVGPAHYEMFGSLEATTTAKGEIVEALAPAGAAVLNADDDRVIGMRSRTRATVITYGTAPDADVRAENVELDDAARARFKVVASAGDADVALAAAGEHMVANALAAIAAGVALDVPLGDAARALGSASAPAWRMEVTEVGGITIVNDAYNANPASTAAALKALVALGRGRRTWAVLGEMAELGPIAPSEHDRIGRLAVRLGVGRVIGVGNATRPLVEAARLEGMTPDETVHASDAADAARIVLDALEPGDVVLVKGSRIAGLERVVQAITEARA